MSMHTGIQNNANVTLCVYWCGVWVNIFAGKQSCTMATCRNDGLLDDIFRKSFG